MNTVFRSKVRGLIIECCAFYSDIENLVLWARSQIIGFAVNNCYGVLEYWNVGILKKGNSVKDN